jgi:hypothetical protein
MTARGCVRRVGCRAHSCAPRARSSRRVARAHTRPGPLAAEHATGHATAAPSRPCSNPVRSSKPHPGHPWKRSYKTMTHDP